MDAPLQIFSWTVLSFLSVVFYLQFVLFLGSLSHVYRRDCVLFSTSNHQSRGYCMLSQVHMLSQNTFLLLRGVTDTKFKIKISCQKYLKIQHQIWIFFTGERYDSPYHMVQVVEEKKTLNHTLYTYLIKYILYKCVDYFIVIP